MVEEEEEEIWEEVEEALAARTSPVHLFRAEILSNPLNSFVFSSGCPSLQKWGCPLVAEDQYQPIYFRKREVD